MKAVIPAAGLGTRLLPATKEQPKEMLPVFSREASGRACLKPMLQMIFEQLYDVGFRQICFIIGREKRAIKDHFTPNYEYADMLEERGRINLANELRKFYKKIESSDLTWINQPEPRGFGDAVLKAARFAKDEPVLVHAGDTYIISDRNRHLKNLVKSHEKLEADAIFLIKEVWDPQRHGVVEVEKIAKRVYRVKNAVEKPKKPPTRLAIMPVYVFHSPIFKALKETPPGKGGEIQLTDAIQKLIEWGRRVYAIELGSKDIRLDIGTIGTYWEALKLSHDRCGLGG